MIQATPTPAQPWPRRQWQQMQTRWQGLSDHNQVGVSLAGVGGVLVLWALFWPVPTEVEGMGVMIYPNNAGTFLLAGVALALALITLSQRANGGPPPEIDPAQDQKRKR